MEDAILDIPTLFFQSIFREKTTLICILTISTKQFIVVPYRIFICYVYVNIFYLKFPFTCTQLHYTTFHISKAIIYAAMIKPTLVSGLPAVK